MSWVLIVIVAWLGGAAIIALFAWGLARTAAIADWNELERLAFERAPGVGEGWVDRRVGPVDRRSATRPWGAPAPGRRSEDLLRRDLAEAQRALAEAEDRVAEAEAHRADGAEARRTA